MRILYAEKDMNAYLSGCFAKPMVKALKVGFLVFGMLGMCASVVSAQRYSGIGTYSFDDVGPNGCDRTREAAASISVENAEIWYRNMILKSAEKPEKLLASFDIVVCVSMLNLIRVDSGNWRVWNILSKDTMYVEGEANSEQIEVKLARLQVSPMSHYQPQDSQVNFYFPNLPLTLLPEDERNTLPDKTIKGIANIYFDLPEKPDTEEANQ